jgi:hypothetical protein
MYGRPGADSLAQANLTHDQALQQKHGQIRNLKQYSPHSIIQFVRYSLLFAVPRRTLSAFSGPLRREQNNVATPPNQNRLRQENPHIWWEATNVSPKPKKGVLSVLEGPQRFDMLAAPHPNGTDVPPTTSLPTGRSHRALKGRSTTARP